MVKASYNGVGGEASSTELLILGAVIVGGLFLTTSALTEPINKSVDYVQQDLSSVGSFVGNQVVGVETWLSNMTGGWL